MKDYSIFNTQFVPGSPNKSFIKIHCRTIHTVYASRTNLRQIYASH